jgi:AcrR family transcriptional regulator
MVTKRARETRSRILQAASEAILVAGAGGLRVDSVAQAANANKRMIYHYFGDKEGLIRAVYGLHAQRLGAKSNGLSEESRQLLNQLMGALSAHAENQAMVSAVLLKDAMQILLPLLMRREGEVANLVDVSPVAWRTFSVEVMDMMFAQLSAKARGATPRKPRYRMASVSRVK